MKGKIQSFPFCFTYPTVDVPLAILRAFLHSLPVNKTERASERVIFFLNAHYSVKHFSACYRHPYTV